MASLSINRRIQFTKIFYMVEVNGGPAVIKPSFLSKNKAAGTDANKRDALLSGVMQIVPTGRIAIFKAPQQTDITAI